MVRATLSSRLAALRQPTRAARIATTLWVVWAVIVWNVTFDRVLLTPDDRQHYHLAITASSEGITLDLRRDEDSAIEEADPR